MAFTDQQQDFAIGWYLSGLSQVEVAKRLGCSQSSVSGFLRRRGVATRFPGRKPGPQSGGGPTELMRAYAQAYDELGTYEAVARRFGVTRQAVHHSLRLFRKYRGQ